MMFWTTSGVTLTVGSTRERERLINVRRLSGGLMEEVEIGRNEASATHRLPQQARSHDNGFMHNYYAK